MLRSFFIALASVLSAASLHALDFRDCFADSTLMLDVNVITAGPHHGVAIESLRRYDGWYGRRHNLPLLQYPSDLNITLTDAASGDTLYREAKFLPLGHQETPVTTYITLPVPRSDAKLTLWGKFPAPYRDWLPDTISATFDISRELIAGVPQAAPYPDAEVHTIRRAADPAHAVYIGIIAEGYTRDERDKFFRHCEQLDSVLFAEAAFAMYADRFNVIGIAPASHQSGISRPSKGIKVDTPLHSHFDSFQLDRLLTVPHSEDIGRIIAGQPVSHVIILANTNNYGGSGPYNDYAIGSALIPAWEQIVIHEFGHSFARLGDEYEAGDEFIYYPADIEPVEPNITTHSDPSKKWGALCDLGLAGYIEGAGYQSTGVWRGCPKCLMRALSDHSFCPVCTHALAKTIQFLTQERRVKSEE